MAGDVILKSPFMSFGRNSILGERGEAIMAKLVFGLNQSLDGYVDHAKFLPSPGLFGHFIEHVRGLAGGPFFFIGQNGSTAGT